MIKMSPGGMLTLDNGIVCRSLIETTIISWVARGRVFEVGSGSHFFNMRGGCREAISLIGM